MLRRIRVEPSRSFRVSYAIDFSHPAIGRQSIENLELGDGVFERKLCRARTFGFLHEVQALWRAGLARGGSLDNTVVLDERRVLNPEGLRMPDEFVRHKVLDLLGDLALLGMPIQGHVKVERGGHALHQRLIAELLSDPSSYEIVTGPRRPAFFVDAPLAARLNRLTRRPGARGVLPSREGDGLLRGVKQRWTESAPPLGIGRIKTSGRSCPRAGVQGAPKPRRP